MVTPLPNPPPQGGRGLSAIWLGRQGYDETHALQVQLRDQVIAAQSGPTLLLVEHEPVIALGRRRIMEDLRVSPQELEAAGIAVRFTERGGRATYHGPGQLVGYPILRLRSVAPTLPDYVWGIEEAIIRALRECGVDAGRDECQRGVWVDGAKIASIGLAVTRGVCWHGFSINANPDPTHLATVRGCGLDSPVCAIAGLTDPPPLRSLAARVARTFGEVFAFPGPVERPSRP
jgi:lipoate-protein ligase B